MGGIEIGQLQYMAKKTLATVWSPQSQIFVWPHFIFLENRGNLYSWIPPFKKGHREVLKKCTRSNFYWVWEAVGGMVEAPLPLADLGRGMPRPGICAHERMTFSWTRKGLSPNAPIDPV